MIARVNEIFSFSSLFYQETFEERSVVKNTDDFTFDFIEDVPFIELSVSLLQKSNFSSNTSKEIFYLFVSTGANIINVIESIIKEYEEPLIFQNSIKFLNYLLTNRILNSLDSDFIHFLIQYYDLGPIEFSNLLRNLFENDTEKIISMEIPSFVFSHDDIIQYHSLFPIFCDHLDYFEDFFQQLILSIFKIIESGKNQATADGLLSMNKIIDAGMFPDEMIDRLIHRLDIILYSEDVNSTNLALDTYLKIEYFPKNSIKQLFNLLKSFLYGGHVADLFYHFSEELKEEFGEEILSHLCESINMNSYLVSTKSLIASTQYVDIDTNDDVKFQFINYFFYYLNENEYTELLITSLSSLLFQVQNQEKVQEMIDENIETLYSLEDHENQIISERAKFIIDSQN